MPVSLLCVAQREDPFEWVIEEVSSSQWEGWPRKNQDGPELNETEKSEQLGS